MKIKHTRYLILAVTMVQLLLDGPTVLAEQEAPTAEYQAGFYYTVKDGDTLWDLSEQFSDSPWQWPELWHNNRKITNPHWIYPGQRLRIFRKSWLGALAPQGPPEPALDEMPAPERAVPFFFYPAIDRIGYIKKNPIRPSGWILKVKDDKELISQGDMVYLRPAAGGTFSPGEQYTIFRTFTGLKNPGGKADIGTQYYITGIVRIIEAEPRYAIGNIIRSYRAIRVADQLQPYLPLSPDIPIAESHPELEGRIIVSEEHAGIFGDNDLAFIDRGSKNGVRPGQQYRIFYQDTQRLGRSRRDKIRLAAVDFGEVFVLRAEETTSTVLITRSDKSISPGAKIHWGTAAPESNQDGGQGTGYGDGEAQD